MDLRTVPTQGPIGESRGRVALRALLVAGAYYWGARIGFALTFQPAPIAILWPPNAMLLAGLLMSPVRSWWAILLAVFPVHVAIQLQSGVPLAMILGWYVSNCSEAVLGAAGICCMLRQRLRFDSFRHVTAFLLCCALLAPFASSFLDVALVKMVGWGRGEFWSLWRTRLFSNMLATLAIVPMLLALHAGLDQWLRKAPWLHQLEGGALVFGLVAFTGSLYVSGHAPASLVPVLLYAPLPILLWAAVRFDPFIPNTAFLLFASLAVTGTLRGIGPFAAGVEAGSALPLQLFLIGCAVPLLLLSAAMQERRAALASPHQRAGIEPWIGASTDSNAQSNVLLAERSLREALERRLAERTGELRRANEVLRRVVARRRKAIKAGRMSEARFSNVFRLSPDAMSISCGEQGPVLDVNDRWQQLFGYRRAEVIGKTARQLNLYANEQADAALSGSSDGPDVVRELEVEMRNRDGAILNTVVSGVRIDCGGESCFITIVRDVTAQRQRDSEAEQQREQLTYLTRVVVMGELSGALAHELNQPLAAILTNAQAARRFLRREPADLHEIGDILDDIVDEDKRAGEVIRRVRALFMKGEPMLQRLDINELVRDALALTHSTLIERKVPVILELGAGLGVVQGDRVQLQQVLLNLIVNACEAMSATAVRDRRLGLLTGAAGDGEVQIAVTDTGPGIAPDAIGKVFDSFFTTKAYGLGFGLSITRAIIVEHGGRIEAVNGPEGGAVFRITLPLAGGLS